MILPIFSKQRLQTLRHEESRVSSTQTVLKYFTSNREHIPLEISIRSTVLSLSIARYARTAMELRGAILQMEELNPITSPLRKNSEGAFIMDPTWAINSKTRPN